MAVSLQSVRIGGDAGFRHPHSAWRNPKMPQPPLIRRPGSVANTATPALRDVLPRSRAKAHPE